MLLLLTAFCTLSPAITAGEKWPGVDESVIQKVAKEQGRGTREPPIKTASGDLLLFLFLLAGAGGGFIGGYYWRILTEKKEQVLQKKKI